MTIDPKSIKTTSVISSPSDVGTDPKTAYLIAKREQWLVKRGSEKEKLEKQLKSLVKDDSSNYELINSCRGRLRCFETLLALKINDDEDFEYAKWFYNKGEFRSQDELDEVAIEITRKQRREAINELYDSEEFNKGFHPIALFVVLLFFGLSILGVIWAAYVSYYYARADTEHELKIERMYSKTEVDNEQEKTFDYSMFWSKFKDNYAHYSATYFIMPLFINACTLFIPNILIAWFITSLYVSIHKEKFPIIKEDEMAARMAGEDTKDSLGALTVASLLGAALGSKGRKH